MLRQPDAAHCLFRVQWRGSFFRKNSSLSLQSYLVRTSVLHLPFFKDFNKLVSVLLVLFRCSRSRWRLRSTARKVRASNQFHCHCSLCCWRGIMTSRDLKGLVWRGIRPAHHCPRGIMSIAQHSTRKGKRRWNDWWGEQTPPCVHATVTLVPV